MRHLKRGAATLLAAACLLPAWAAPVQEVLTNPGFEADSPPLPGVTITDCLAYQNPDGTPMFPNHPQVSGKVGSGWTSNNCWMSKPNSIVKLSVEPAGRLGGYSQLIDTDGASGDAMLNSSWLTLTSGSRYTTSVWIKADRAAEVVVTLRENNGSYTQYGLKAQKLAQNVWTEVKFDAIGPQVAMSTSYWSTRGFSPVSGS